MKRLKKHPWLITVAILITMALVACGGTDVEPSLEDTPESDSAGDAVTPVIVDMDDVTDAPAEDESPNEMPAPGLPDPEAFMTDRAVTALAERLSMERDAISVESVEAIEWSDAALGCPTPNQLYAQVLTPGFKITLSADGETYTYHTDMDGAMVLCGTDGQPVGEVR